MARRSLLLLDPLEEVGDDREEALRLLVVLHVGALLEDDELRAADSAAQRVHLARRGLVVAAGGDQRRDVELAEAVGDVPVAERARDHELVRALHGLVHVRMVDHAPEGAQDGVGPRVDAADVAAVEDHRCGLVLGRVEGAGRLVLVEYALNVGGQLAAKPRGLFYPERDARGRRREHQARETGWLGERVLHREHATPGRAEEVDAFEPECFADGADLLDEELDRPLRRVGLEPRAAAAELVVEDDAPSRPGELFEGLEVVVGRAGTAVEAEERQPPGPLAVADDPVPGLAAGVRDPALAHGGEPTTRPGVRRTQGRRPGRGAAPTRGARRGPPRGRPPPGQARKRPPPVVDLKVDERVLAAGDDEPHGHAEAVPFPDERWIRDDDPRASPVEIVRRDSPAIARAADLHGARVANTALSIRGAGFACDPGPGAPSRPASRTPTRSPARLD